MLIVCFDFSSSRFLTGNVVLSLDGLWSLLVIINLRGMRVECQCFYYDMWIDCHIFTIFACSDQFVEHCYEREGRKRNVLELERMAARWDILPGGTVEWKRWSSHSLMYLM